MKYKATVSAKALGIAWRNAALFSAADSSRPQLNRVMWVEIFPGNRILLASSDSFSLGVATVGLIPWQRRPDHDGAVAHISDFDSEMLEFMKRLAKADASESATVTSSRDTRSVTVEALGEEVTLSQTGVAFDWRKSLPRETKPTEEVILSRRLLTRLSKLAGVDRTDEAIKVELCGSTGAVAFSVPMAGSSLFNVWLMPMRSGS